MSTVHGTALITGASSGIGKVYADRLAHRGYDLILVARDKGRLDDLAASLAAAAGVKVEALKADLTAKADLLKVEERLAGDGAITLFINNAGIGGAGPLAKAGPDKAEAIVLLNVLAATRLAAVAAKSFAARGNGAIVNIGSVLGLAPERFPGNYSATKAYLLALTQSMNAELGDKGVKLQAVLPGATRTEIWERTGLDVNTLPPEMLMEVDELVDAALTGFDAGELVTIPSLPDVKDWEALEAARAKLGPNLSRNTAAARYKAA